MAIILKTAEIEKRRRALGLTLQEAADRAGFSTAQQFFNVERGARASRPSAETMLRVARAIGCRVEDLVELRDDKKRRK